MSVSLGANSKLTGLSFSSNRKILKLSDNTLILFIIDSTDIKKIQYKISTDNGITWSGSWTVSLSHTNNVRHIDICIDNSDNIYISFTDLFDGTIWFVLLTYVSGGTWSAGTPVQVHATDIGNHPNILFRSNGDLWILAYGNSGSQYLLSYYSTDSGSTWNRNTPKDNGAIISDLAVTIKGTYIWAFVRQDTNTTVKLYEWDSAWDSGSTISTLVTASTNNTRESSLGIGRISDTEIYLATKTGSGIRVYKYTGTWDSGSLVSDNAGDESPTIGIVVDNPYIVFRSYDGIYYNISYIIYTGVSWSEKVDITTGTDTHNTPSALQNHTGRFIFTWNKGTIAPLEVYVESLPRVQGLSSDAKLVDHYEQTIVSDAKIVIEVLSDITNKINTVLSSLLDIPNKINTVLRTLSDISNYINTCIASILDISNDIRTQKLVLGDNDITNDIRFLYSWQKAANNDIQSLGKTYIRVYIAGVEQTDVDIDSINISKDLNTSHSASFDLGRAYDSSKPTMESIVEIKYHIWTLYYGYITNISPVEDPEKMRINCQNEYWKDNKTNVYYHVGHTPSDNKELYYNTIKTALATQHSWNLNIGDFIPQEINNFALGKSDAITNLITSAGNYGWFYDTDLSKKLWSAGEGSIINIDRQILGENIKLYDLLSHSFDENVEGIVNKYRVQMGDKVIRKFDSSGGSRTYTGYNYSSYHQYITPAWDGSYEVLAKYSGSGEGWDYHRPSNADSYRDVFKKYNMPYLNPELSSWSDRYPPYVEVYSTRSLMANSVVGVLKEGFTIDYENGTITFNDPIYCYDTDANGEIIGIRAPLIKVFLWKKNYFTYTLTPSDNPESDISNELMFFTPKMGSYSDTIIKDLNLSSLSIQEGGVRILADGTTEYIPSWDDTEFALDYANWELSKLCDKKIKGTIDVTLDALCFYNIDLTKRIYINGITDTPMNILSINYNLSNFTVTLTLENSRYYKRTVNFQSHGE